MSITMHVLLILTRSCSIPAPIAAKPALSELNTALVFVVSGTVGGYLLCVCEKQAVNANMHRH